MRAVWLAWSHVVKLSRGDVLALARARDRLLERLFHNVRQARFKEALKIVSDRHA